MGCGGLKKYKVRRGIRKESSCEKRILLKARKPRWWSISVMRQSSHLRRGRGKYRKAAPTWRAHHQKDVVGMCWIAALPILMKYLKKKVWTGLAIRVLDSETA